MPCSEAPSASMTKATKPRRLHRVRSGSPLLPALVAIFAALMVGCGWWPFARSSNPATPSPAETTAASATPLPAETIAASDGGQPDGPAPAPAFCPILPCPKQLVTRRILEHDERFGSVVCKAGMEVSVATSGQLVACKLAKAVTIDGLPLAADTFVRFDPEGHVASMELRAPRAFELADGTKVQCGAD